MTDAQYTRFINLCDSISKAFKGKKFEFIEKNFLITIADKHKKSITFKCRQPFNVTKKGLVMIICDNLHKIEPDKLDFDDKCTIAIKSENKIPLREPVWQQKLRKEKKKMENKKFGKKPFKKNFNNKFNNNKPYYKKDKPYV